MLQRDEGLYSPWGSIRFFFFLAPWLHFHAVSLSAGFRLRVVRLPQVLPFTPSPEQGWLFPGPVVDFGSDPSVKRSTVIPRG